ncbi:MAG: hypothetical protein E6Q97_24480 [Desulfurellales bacterium]|nr:MAG: hypothetical protein E6Q97_24480 [Desulfurellales bacterium]
MAEGRQTESWNHTASILAQIHNANPYQTKGRKPEDFLPSRLAPPSDCEMSLSAAAAFFGRR